MIHRLLSHDLPRSRWLSLALLAILVGLALAPFLFPGAKSLNVAAKVCVFIVLAASFDLLLGYTGIVSFAHTMFFGIGAYAAVLGAPQDGTPIFVCNRYYSENGWLPTGAKWGHYHPNSKGEAAWRDASGAKLRLVEYWMPLPEGPKLLGDDQ